MRGWYWAAFACGCAGPSRPLAPSEVSEPPPATAPASSSGAPAAVSATAVKLIRPTPKLPAACGPDYLERHATSLSDLDGDGTLDRPSIVRDDASLTVRLYELPSFREKGSWKLPSGYVEIATPRRAGSTRGDLWISVGQKVDKAPNGWKETFYHLEGGALAPVTTSYREMKIRLDVDGDGRVDPIGSSGGAVRALLADDKWFALPVALSSQVHGAPMPNDQQAAVDLDGNGVPEIVIERKDALAIVEVPSLREVWSVKGKPYKPSLVEWGSSLVLVVRLDQKLKIFTTDDKHSLIAEYPDAPSYAEVPAAIDSELVMTGHPWQFFERAKPARRSGSIHELVRRIDDREAPFGPVRLDPKDAPGLVALSVEPGQGLEIQLVDPKTRTIRRKIWSTDAPSVASDINASLVDLDRDGTSELLIEHVMRTAFHHGASWNTSSMQIIDGSGEPSWEEQGARTDEWLHEGGGRGRMRQIRSDGTHVRAFDLADGTMPLRVRSDRDEYYLLAGSSRIQAVPACLE